VVTGYGEAEVPGRNKAEPREWRAEAAEAYDRRGPRSNDGVTMVIAQAEHGDTYKYRLA
jgi:hypothetical protein